MKDRKPPRRLARVAALGALLIAAILLTPVTQAQNGVANPGVFTRMVMMSQATTAVETLANMMGGRIRFDRVQARAARRTLINTMRAIPSAFKKPHGDPLSRARPDIWIRWDDFKTRADSAKRTARQLDVDRLGSLRSTLPDMINACLSCHQIYRKP